MNTEYGRANKVVTTWIGYLFANILIQFGL